MKIKSGALSGGDQMADGASRNRTAKKKSNLDKCGRDEGGQITWRKDAAMGKGAE